MLCLLCGAQSARSANIPIPTLPYSVAAPGTYVLTGNLSYPHQGSTPAITIASSIPGPVILDLNGFTITGTPGLGFVGISVGANAYPVTVCNGTLRNFQYGIYAAFSAGIDINNLNIFTNAAQMEDATAGIVFFEVQSSVIHDCTFHGGWSGIEDEQSPGGNLYYNDIFMGVYQVLNSYNTDGDVSDLNNPTIIGFSYFAMPPVQMGNPTQ